MVTRRKKTSAAGTRRKSSGGNGQPGHATRVRKNAGGKPTNNSMMPLTGVADKINFGYHAASYNWAH